MGHKIKSKTFWTPPPYCNWKGITPHPRFCMEDKYYSELLRNCCMIMSNCIIGPLFYWELWSKTRHSCWRGASKIVLSIISIILWWFYLMYNKCLEFFYLPWWGWWYLLISQLITTRTFKNLAKIHQVFDLPVPSHTLLQLTIKKIN